MLKVRGSALSFMFAAIVSSAAVTADPGAMIEGHSLSGSITLGGQPLPNAAVILGVNGGGSLTRTGADGSYSFPDLLDGEYTLTPQLPGHAFTPAKRTIRLQDYNASSLDFSATRTAPAAAAAIATASTIPAPVAPAAPMVAPPSPPAATTAAPATLAVATPPATVVTPPPVPPVVAPDLVIPAAVTGSPAPPPASAPLTNQVSGRVTVNGVPAPRVTVNFNIVRNPGQNGYTLPSSVTDADGRYTLAVPEAAAPHEAQAWVEAHDSLNIFCPAQIFPATLADPGSADFASCTPPAVSKAARQLSGRVLRKGKGVPRVAIHQAFAMRKGNEYSNAQIGPAVAYTDADGGWQFNAPSISARTLGAGFLSYLTAQLPGGPRFCPGQLFLPETLGGSAAGLDFDLCPGQLEDNSPDSGALISAAPAQGRYTAVSLALEGENATTPVLAYVHAGAEADGGAAILFTRWDAQARQWSAPVKAGVSLAQGAALQRVSLAGNGKTLAIAYTDLSDALGEHVEVVGSSDGGRNWQTLPLGGFAERSSNPSIAVSDLGDMHLAYYYEGTENLRRIVYQKRRAGGEFRAVALPLSNLLNHNSGWWSLPALSLSLDENDVPGVVYFLGGPDSYTQLAFWKPGMGTAAKIAESRQSNTLLSADLAMTAGHATAVYALDGSAWIAGGGYGQAWETPVALPLPASDLQIALAGDQLLAAGSEAGRFALRRGSDRKRLAPMELPAEQAPRPSRYSLALDGDNRAIAAFVNEVNGTLMLYREPE